jgi:hypothetical protein
MYCRVLEAWLVGNHMMEVEEESLTAVAVVGHASILKCKQSL